MEHRGERGVLSLSCRGRGSAPRPQVPATATGRYVVPNWLRPFASSPCRWTGKARRG